MPSPRELSARRWAARGGLNGPSLLARYPPAGMLVPSGIRYLAATAWSSVRSQPPTSTLFAVGLWSSTRSASGGTLAVRISLITTGGTVGSGSAPPGDPPGWALLRQAEPRSGAWLRPGAFGTRENP